MNEHYKDIDGVIIYARVSSDKQRREGDGLDSQETLCRQFVERLGLADKIEAVYPDDRSGKFFDRPGMKQVMDHLDANRHKKYLVVFDDLKRFARNTEVHFQLKAEICVKRKAMLASPNFSFDDSPSGRFVETIFAAQAQLEREQNAQQVKDKTRARLLNGYWTFPAPPGYVYAKNPLHGKILVEEPLVADCVRRVFQAVGDLEVVTYEQAGDFLKNELQRIGIESVCRSERLRRILRCKLYTGVVEYRPWGIDERPGKHQAIIPTNLFYRVQEVLTGRSHKPARKDYSEDYPLRGHVRCFLCGRLLTASWTAGRSKRYPYYHCGNMDCGFYSKGLPRELVEAKFLEFLADLAPTARIVAFIKWLVGYCWDQERANLANERASLTSDAEKLDAKVIDLLDSANRASSHLLKAEYEKRAEAVIQDREAKLSEARGLEHRYANAGVGTAADKVLSYIAKPVEMWRTGSLKDKKNILEMYFDECPAYDPEYGFGTAALTCFAELLQVKRFSKNRQVDIAQKSWNQIVEYVEYWGAKLTLETNG